MTMPNDDFLGLMLVSRVGDLLRMTVPPLAERCGTVLLITDNMDEATGAEVEALLGSVKNLVAVPSGFDPSPPGDEEIPAQVYRRFRRLQPHVRERAIFEARRMIGEGCPAKAVVWPDSDEIPHQEFWGSMAVMMGSDSFDAVATLPADVYGDMSTLMAKSMGYHIRGFRWLDGVSAFPWNGACRYNPFVPERTMLAPREMVHLACLTSANREFRRAKWARNSKVPGMDDPLWDLGKDVMDASTSEIIDKLNGPSDMTVSGYHQRHG